MFAETKTKYVVPHYNPEPLDLVAKEFFKNRMIGADVLAKNNIGLKDGAICFPYVKGGQVVNIKHRGIKKEVLSGQAG